MYAPDRPLRVEHDASFPGPAYDAALDLPPIRAPYPPLDHHQYQGHHPHHPYPQQPHPRDSFSDRYERAPPPDFPYPAHQQQQQQHQHYPDHIRHINLDPALTGPGHGHGGYAAPAPPALPPPPLELPSADASSSSSSRKGTRREKARLGDAAMGADHPDGKNRPRAFVACQPCRARKIKCDGTKPICHNCERKATSSSVECVYDATPRRRGPDRMPGTRQRTTKEAKQRAMVANPAPDPAAHE